MQNSSESTYVNCPHCNKEVLWHQKSESRPFCSERCRLIDLGEWIEEKNKIPTSIEDDFSPY